AKGMRYLLIEKKYVGALIKDTMAEKKFYHVYGRNTAVLRGMLHFPDRVHGSELVELWQTQAASLHMTIDTVVSIQRQDGLFQVASPTQTYQGTKVILTSGTFENPRKLHVPGEAGHPNIFYSLDYYNDYEDKAIMVVGGGNSALETAIYHGEHNKIVLIVRKDNFAESVTPKNRAQVEAMVAAGKISVLWQSKLVRIVEQSATIEHDGTLVEQPFDYLFIHAGYERPLEFLKSAGIVIEESLGGGKPQFNDHFETNVPGLYLAGGLTGADSVIESSNQAFDIVNYFTEKAG
ncbi:MAG: hypothetical protein A2542_03000, partial [Parcubacteria group bacterium RIFOXYD2_FULL_52_8]